jgi:hypothetical protein
MQRVALLWRMPVPEYFSALSTRLRPPFCVSLSPLDCMHCILFTVTLYFAASHLSHHLG